MGWAGLCYGTTKAGRKLITAESDSKTEYNTDVKPHLSSYGASQVVMPLILTIKLTLVNKRYST